MSARLLARAARSDPRLYPGVCIVLLSMAILLAGCENGPSAPNQEPGTKNVTLPDGTILAIPVGATYFYSHSELPSSGTIPRSSSETELVVARIDWSFCNPSTAKVEFMDQTSNVVPYLTWRVPTRITTPLTGINILGIFAGSGTLEGGIRMGLFTAGFPPTNGVTFYRITNACAGDWVSLYGYTR